MDPESQLSFKIYLDMGDDSQPEVRRFGIPQCNVTNYLFLKDKIRAMFPPLRNSTSNFKVSWKDDDGDLIAITSDEELLIALTEMSEQEIRKLYVSILPNSVDENQFPRGPANVANGINHANVVCDNCAGPVQGYRYKCIQCADFDLCTNCEMRGAHAEHVMIRMPNPLPLSNNKPKMRLKQHVLGCMYKKHFSPWAKEELRQTQDCAFQKHHSHNNHSKKRHVLGCMHKRRSFHQTKTELHGIQDIYFRKPHHKHHKHTKKAPLVGYMNERHPFSHAKIKQHAMRDTKPPRPHHKLHDHKKKINNQQRGNFWGPNFRNRSHFTKGLAHRFAKMSRKHERKEARNSRHCRFEENPHQERRTGEGCPANAWFSNFLAQLSEMGVTGSGHPETPGQEPQHEPQQQQQHQHQEQNQPPPQQGQPGRQYQDFPNCTAISELVNGIVDSCLTNVGPIVEKLVDPMINPQLPREKVPPPQPFQTSEKSGEKPKDKFSEFMEPPIIDLELRLGDELLGSFSTESFKTCEKSKGTPSDSSNQMDQSDSANSDKEMRPADDGKKQDEASQVAPTQTPPQSIPRDQSMEVDGWTVLTSNVPVSESASKGEPSTSAGTTSTPNQVPSDVNQPRVVPVTAPVENLYPSLSSEIRSQNPKVNESLDKMLSMGFSNNGGWLLKLLEQCNGEIEMVCQMLEPVVNKQNQQA